jgi:Leucine-rich repeat (LRR) protein
MLKNVVLTFHVKFFFVLRHTMIKIPPGQVMIATLLLQFVTVSPCPPSCSCNKENTNCSSISLTAVPANVDSNTTAIDMSFNNISTLTNKDFVNLTHLEVILLDNNDISRLEPYVFYRTEKLLQLNLNNNKIFIMNLSLFKSLDQLRHLYLQNNMIQHIHPRLFEHNPHLVLLDISGNLIHNFEPKTFRNNRILSWVNVTGNPLTLPLKMKELFNSTFNIMDIEFCDSTNSSISAFQKVPSVNLIGTNYTTVVNLDEFTSFGDSLGLDLNEIAYLRMKQFCHLNRFSFASVNKMTIGDDLNVMSTTGEEILCYCRHFEFWFWCAEQPQARCEKTVTKSEKYKILGCNIDTHNVTPAKNQANDIVSDTNKRTGPFLPYRRPVNWETFRNTLLKAAVPMFIIMLVVGACVFKRVRAARNETLPSYSEVKT